MINISSGCEVSTLPVVESVVGDQAINSDDRPDQKSFTLLEALYGIDPRIVDVCREFLIVDTNEPIDFVIDEILTLNFLDLLLVTFEGVL